MTPLVGKTRAELEALAAQLGARPFRGRQLARWVYRHAASGFDEMTDLPATLRHDLAEQHAVRSAEVAARLVSADGTVRLALRLSDGAIAECVYMPSGDAPSADGSATICVSTQVGCAVGCLFCATGAGGLERNLSPGEIAEQVLFAAAEGAHRGTPDLRQASLNVVYMGMGEPFLNYENTVASLRLLREAVGIGARAITVSTIGLPDGIRAFARDEPQVNLAVSLHAPTDDLRASLVPSPLVAPIADLMAAVRDYIAATHRRVSFEYVVLAGVNDGPEQADALADLLTGLLCHINLIPYNATDGPYRAPSPAQVSACQHRLQERGLNVTVRASRGQDISAACGQLHARLT